MSAGYGSGDWLFCITLLSTLLLISSAAADTGTLAIDSVPSGATVYIDGSPAGTTPLTTSTITAGDHTLKLSLIGYNDFTATVSIPAGGTATGTYTLVAAATATPTPPPAGTMIIESVPAGASVYVDGAPAGTTPYTGSVAAGDHSVQLTMTGYADFPSTVTVPAGGEVKERLVLSCNILVVESDPSGASFFVDGVLKGTTPQTLREVPAGSHTLLFRKSGYGDHSRSVVVPPGTEVHVTGTLVSAGSPSSSATTAAAETVTLTVTPTTIATTALQATVPATGETTLPVTPEKTAAIATKKVTQPLPVQDTGTCTAQFTGSGRLDTGSDGRLNCTTVLSTEDNVLTLRIPAGTRITNSSGGPVFGLQVTRANLSAPGDPAGNPGTSLPFTYRYSPEDARFDRQVTIIFTPAGNTSGLPDTGNMTIAEIGMNGQVLANLPTTRDTSAGSFSTTIVHVTTIALLPAGAQATPVEDPEPENQDPASIIRIATQPGAGPLPASPFIPGKLAPLAAVASGIAIVAAGNLAAGNPAVSRLWEKIVELVKKFTGFEATGIMNAREIEKRGIRPSANLPAVMLGISPREMLVIAASALAFAIAFLLRDRLELTFSTIVIFIMMGGIATILRDLAQKYVALRYGCITEYQFWGLGTATMLFTAWLFGNVFAKPCRTLVRSETKPPVDVTIGIKLTGPLVSIVLAIASLFLIPLGGFCVIAGSAGFTMNLLYCVFSLLPVQPNSGVEVYAWNRLAWAALFIPVMAFYLYVYLLA